MRFTIAPFTQALVGWGEIGTHAKSLNGLAKDDCYAMPSAVVYNTTGVEVVARFLTKDLDH